MSEYTVTEETVTKKSGNKKLHIIYISVITVLLIGIGVGTYFVSTAYKDAVADSKAAYETAKADYDKAHARILDEEKTWKTELSDTQKDLKTVTDELALIYATRDAERMGEELRWNALSDEEKLAETMCNKYNEMVSELRKSNKEYAQLYVQYSLYLNQDIFNLDKASLLQYTDLYNRKMQIEKEYMSKHPF